MFKFKTWIVLRLITADGRGCYGKEDVVGVQNTSCDQEQHSSPSKFDLLGVHPGQSKKHAFCQGVKHYQKKIALLPSTAESSFSQRLIYLIFWHQNAIKQCIQNCIKWTRPWFQSIAKLYSPQTSVSGWGSGKFFHHWHSQLWRALRNPPASLSLVLAQGGTGYILALWKQDFYHSSILTGLFFLATIL